MSSFKELNGPLETEFHSLFKLGGDCDGQCSTVNLPPQPSRVIPQEETFISFDQSTTKGKTFVEYAEKREANSDAVQHLRATMPDHTRCVINATIASLSDSSSSANNNSNKGQQQSTQFVPIATVLQNSPLSSPKFVRRYSKPQGDSDANCQESSVDGEDILENFQKSFSVQSSHRLTRRGSSPEVVGMPTRITNILPTPVVSNTTTASSDNPTVFPQHSILNKMVGSKQQQTTVASPAVNQCESSSNSSLTAVSSWPNLQNIDNKTQQIVNPAQKNITQQHSGTVCDAHSQMSPASQCQTNSSDSIDSSSSGFGILSKTRQFGTWLGLTVDGNNVEITKKDLNVFAPTTF